MKMRNKISLILGLRRFKRIRTGIVKKEKSISYIKSKYKKFGVGAGEQEIYASCILLKNLAIVHKEKPLSMDGILEELIEGSTHLKPVYGEVLLRWRSGEGERSFSSIYEHIPCKASENFSRILSKIDSINLAELVEAMKSFEEAFSGERITLAMKRSYIKSVISTVSAVAGVFAILMNFVVVVVFMNMKDMLTSIL